MFLVNPGLFIPAPLRGAWTFCIYLLWFAVRLNLYSLLSFSAYRRFIAKNRDTGFLIHISFFFLVSLLLFFFYSSYLVIWQNVFLRLWKDSDIDTYCCLMTKTVYFFVSRTIIFGFSIYVCLLFRSLVLALH